MCLCVCLFLWACVGICSKEEQPTTQSARVYCRSYSGSHTVYMWVHTNETFIHTLVHCTHNNHIDMQNCPLKTDLWNDFGFFFSFTYFYFPFSFHLFCLWIFSLWTDFSTVKAYSQKSKGSNLKSFQMKTAFNSFFAECSFFMLKK